MQQIFYAVDVLAASVVAIKALSLISIYILPSRFGRYAHALSNGDQPWALVTGTSDGIGRAFVKEFAVRGVNVVLHGRNHAKLSLVMSQLQKNYPERSFRALVSDASHVPCMSYIHQPAEMRPEISAIQEAISDFTISSADQQWFAPLSECSAERVTSNISLIISSMADQGLPLVTLYSSNKQFIMNTTRSASLEMVLEGKEGQFESLGVRISRVTGVSASDHGAGCT